MEDKIILTFIGLSFGILVGMLLYYLLVHRKEKIKPITVIKNITYSEHKIVTLRNAKIIPQDIYFNFSDKVISDMLTEIALQAKPYVKTDITENKTTSDVKIEMMACICDIGEKQ